MFEITHAESDGGAPAAFNQIWNYPLMLKMLGLLAAFRCF